MRSPGRGWNVQALVLGGSLMCQLAFPSAGAAQDLVRPGAINVLISCDTSFFGGCDIDDLRRTITFVNHVRDRREAQIHVVVTAEGLGSGGTRYHVRFVGSGSVEKDVAGSGAPDDQVDYDAADNQSVERTRQGIARAVRLGLGRFLALSDIAPDISLVAQPPSSAKQAAETHDPWHGWTFSLGASLFREGADLEQFSNGFYNANADRVTKERKTTASINIGRSSSEFDIDGEKLVSKTSFDSASLGHVLGLGPKWSWGVFASSFASSNQNVERSGTLNAGVEYNFFPYEESARHQLRILIRGGITEQRYIEPTVFDRTTERFPAATTIVTLDQKQPWGTFRLATTFLAHIPRTERNRLSLNGTTSIRVRGGLQINLNGSYSRVRDNIALPRGVASDDEILLQRRQLATGFNYNFNASVTYRFGSKFSNVINPRFGS